MMRKQKRGQTTIIDGRKQKNFVVKLFYLDLWAYKFKFLSIIFISFFTLFHLTFQLIFIISIQIVLLFFLFSQLLSVFALDVRELKSYLTLVCVINIEG